MTGFEKNWSNQSSSANTDKLKEAIRPQGPLKPRLETAINKLQMQVSKLDTLIIKMNERDASLFRRVVDSMQRHDGDTAKILSNELAEVRKISKTLNNSKMALEQVSMRLSTIHDMGDAMVTLGPAMASIKGLKSSLGRFVPGADSEINNMQTLLNSIMMESVQGSVSVDVNAGAGNDIDQILLEAISELAKHGATMAFYLSVHLIGDVVRELLKGGVYTEQTPAAIVYRATWEDQKIIRGTLGDIAKKTKEAKIIKTALIIVGDVLAPKHYEYSKVYDAGFTHGYRKAAPNANKNTE